MKKTEKIPLPERKSKPKRIRWILAMISIFLVLAAVGGLMLLDPFDLKKGEDKDSQDRTTSQEEPIQDAEISKTWETGFVSTVNPDASYFDADGVSLGKLIRGTEILYSTGADGKIEISCGGKIGYLEEGANIVSDSKGIIPTHTLYVRSAVNLRDAEGKLLLPFAQKGDAVEVIGFDRLYENGEVHMFQVNLGGEIGFIMPWYLADTREEALENYDVGNYSTHAARGDEYGGGGAADLDYFPRNKGAIEGNTMPSECHALYLVTWRIGAVDEYIKLAENTGINTFVVDIMDGGAIGYDSEVMRKYSPSAASAAGNSAEQYKAAIQKLKDAGYYVIGRITTFNDSYFIADHPEYAIKDLSGNPLKLSGAFWPTPFNRTAWQYKVDLAVEAAELMGFHEIQFDYVRFPDNVRRYEKAGTVDLGNRYGETKAQAIQRFLMYATDILHEHGVYVSADVYGESAYTYVTTYGQYWPAISGVVDAISGMPYPDHFSASGSWLPWEHPYETLNTWGKSVMRRQGETANPAVVRTWIQAYNAIRPPYNEYGPNEISAQIRGLRDSGCTGGYMTWHATASIDQYPKLLPAFGSPAER